MHTMNAAAGAAIGAICGLASLVVIWVLNNEVRGVRAFPQEQSNHGR